MYGNIITWLWMQPAVPSSSELQLSNAAAAMAIARGPFWMPVSSETVRQWRRVRPAV